MTETQRSTARQGSSRAVPEPTAWVGWILFAATMLILVGSFQIIAGFVALFSDDYYNVGSSQLVLHVDYTGWGVVHLILGTLAIAAGYGIMSGKTWARAYAILLAGLSAIANLMFIQASPVWGTIVITLDVLVIWALCVHGREVEHVDEFAS